VTRSAQAIAFDWGGVFTVGTFDRRANARLATRYGVAPADLWPHYLELMEHFEVGGYDLPGFHAALDARLGRTLPPTLFEPAFLDAPLERPAMYQLLARVPSEYRVGMLSNNVPVLCDRVRHDPRCARIERFVFSNEIGVRKPDPAAFAALVAAMELPAHDILFIDDNAGNIDAAEAFGLQALLLDTPAGFATRWRGALPDLAELVAAPFWALTREDDGARAGA
jgi:putative hydrolase of the HAD superfamily